MLDKRKKLYDLIQKNIIILDGAMGTRLIQKGVDFNDLKYSNTHNKELVRSIHCEYLENGSDIIFTNTFNKFYKDMSLEDINEIKLSITNAKVSINKLNKVKFIAGDISPIWDYTKNEYLDFSLALPIYKNMIDILSGEVDLFILETFSDFIMVLEILKIINIYDIPIMVSFSFSKLVKENFHYILKELTKYKVVAVGFNCFSINDDIDNYVKNILQTNLKVILKPNMGLPKVVDNNYFYKINLDDIAKFINTSIENGATIFGGCCGSNGSVINTISNIIKTYN